MQICVTGWVYPREFYEALLQVHPRHFVVVMAKRPCEYPLPAVTTPNIGLDWYSYDRFIKEHWDGQSAVFFTHDDTIVHDVSVFDKIDRIQADVAFIFKNEYESKGNMQMHGRALKMSPRMIDLVLGHRCTCKDVIVPGEAYHSGLWYDIRNVGEMDESDPTKSGFHYNSAVWHFSRQIHELKQQTPSLRFAVFHVPEYDSGIRGQLGDSALEAERKVFELRRARRGGIANGRT